jgi:hypothetical protein
MLKKNFDPEMILLFPYSLNAVPVFEAVKNHFNREPSKNANEIRRIEYFRDNVIHAITNSSNSLKPIL